MEEAFHGRFTEEDWRSPSERSFEANWANRTSFERNTMVKEGLLQPVKSAGRGYWALTHAGWALYRQHS
ncbi:hypothetical protein ACPPVO_42780 [Dactylosporangium sp. McL0621]|uniref:hypothetical protein n=1 Tax=Dactylosporangium sp. McL0621 TaxID=3415678 RepID=UPI003CF0D294